MLQLMCDTYQANSLKPACAEWSITQANMSAFLDTCLKIFIVGQAAGYVWL